MTLNVIVNDLKSLLEQISIDLEKAIGGNKAAAQRVRTGTIKLEKVSKDYRKKSIEEEKEVKDKDKKTAKKAAPAPAKKAADTNKKSVKASSKGTCNMEIKRPTAKIPCKK